MTIKQFNGQWVSEEDRLLFRFNTLDDLEFRFWLTRNATKTIIAGSQQLFAEILKTRFTPGTAEVVQEFQQQAAIQTTQFNEAYTAGANLVLGEHPLLVTGVSMQAENGLMSIDLRLLTRQNVNIRITPAAFQKMVLLLLKLQEQAQWSIDLPRSEAKNQPEDGTTATAAKSVVH
jgi:hypothetical protein